MTVAIDSDPERARAFALSWSGPTLLDTGGALAGALDFHVIPNGFCFDRSGALVGEQRGGFDIRSDEGRALTERWLAEPPREACPLPASDGNEARELFARGSARLGEGRRDDALRLWQRAYLLDPRNFIIRKQIWRLLYPERFGDPLDLEWQREQIAREEALGFSAAIAGLPR